MRWISLTTDFGTQDWFAGVLKGVIARLAPKARVIDLTHQIAPGDVRAGALALAAGAPYFPKGTIHVAIVDPGVGSQRRAIAVETDNYIYVGPDNGVISWALAVERVHSIHELSDESYWLQPLSRTFHGRDLFAPVAAHLARGVPVRKLGPSRREYVQLDWPLPKKLTNGIQGEVVYVDRFGNAVTNLVANLVEPDPGKKWEAVGSAPRWSCPVGAYYQAVSPGKAVALPGSTGLLEIAINGGSAEKVLGLKVGSMVVLRKKKK